MASSSVVADAAEVSSLLSRKRPLEPRDEGESCICTGYQLRGYTELVRR